MNFAARNKEQVISPMAPQENEIVSQYLNLQKPLQFFQLLPQNSVPKTEKNGKPPKPKKAKKRSQYHNFQKHLLTTVRRNVRLQQQLIPERISKPVQEIWKEFKNLKIYTKELLLAITNPKISSAVLKKCQLAQIANQYSREIFHEVQEYLRKEIISQINEIDSEDLLDDRKLEKKDKFLSYFYVVVKELENGTINCRYVAPAK